jgi:hypothetical protein
MRLMCFIAPCWLAALLAAPAAAQNPREGLLVLVDHAATSAEAADRCEQRHPGTGTAIREAHARWRAQHDAAQTQMLEKMLAEVQAKAAARGDHHDSRQVLDLLRSASLDKLRNGMSTMDAATFERFCTDYPKEFDKPAMDFTDMWLRMQSRR